MADQKDILEALESGNTQGIYGTGNTKDVIQYLIMRVRKTEHERDQALLGNSTVEEREQAVVRRSTSFFSQEG